MLFVESLDAPRIERDDYHHISKVLREPDGAAIVLCDGAGAWRRATLAQEPEPTGPIEVVDRRTPELVVGFALIKGDRPELVVQKLTELGIDRIVPLVTDHGVVRWKGDRAAKQRERFIRIAREASMQCRRTHLPALADLQSFDTFCDEHPTLKRCDAGGRSLISSVEFAPDAPVVVAVGPEGGWSEREQLMGEPVGLGDHILRAETAAISVAAILGALRSR